MNRELDELIRAVQADPFNYQLWQRMLNAVKRNGLQLWNLISSRDVDVGPVPITEWEDGINIREFIGDKLRWYQDFPLWERYIHEHYNRSDVERWAESIGLFGERIANHRVVFSEEDGAGIEVMQREDDGNYVLIESLDNMIKVLGDHELSLMPATPFRPYCHFSVEGWSLIGRTTYEKSSVAVSSAREIVQALKGTEEDPEVRARALDRALELVEEPQPQTVAHQSAITSTSYRGQLINASMEVNGISFGTGWFSLEVRGDDESVLVGLDWRRLIDQFQETLGVNVHMGLGEDGDPQVSELYEISDERDLEFDCLNVTEQANRLIGYDAPAQRPWRSRRIEYAGVPVNLQVYVNDRVLETRHFWCRESPQPSVLIRSWPMEFEREGSTQSVTVRVTHDMWFSRDLEFEVSATEFRKPIGAFLAECLREMTQFGNPIVSRTNRLIRARVIPYSDAEQRINLGISVSRAGVVLRPGEHYWIINDYICVVTDPNDDPAQHDALAPTMFMIAREGEPLSGSIYEANLPLNFAISVMGAYRRGRG